MWEKLVDNLWLKLGAIILACLLWIHASTDKLYDYTFDYHLKMVNFPPELVLVEPLPSTVKVKIYGKGKELLKLLLTKDKSVRIDARRFSSGESELQLKNEMINVPEGLNLSVVEIESPRALKINLQRVEEKEVPVISQLRLLPQEGYFQKGKARFTPESVKLTGPSENVEKISYVLTQEKEFQDLKKSLSESIDLVPPTSYNLQISPQKVEFFADIEKGERKILEKLPVKLLNPPKGEKVVLSPKTVDLELLGEKETLDKLSPETVKISIDCKELKKGENRVYPLIQLPEDVLLIKAEPDSFKVELK